MEANLLLDLHLNLVPDLSLSNLGVRHLSPDPSQDPSRGLSRDLRPDPSRGLSLSSLAAPLLSRATSRRPSPAISLSDLRLSRGRSRRNPISPGSRLRSRDRRTTFR